MTIKYFLISALLTAFSYVFLPEPMAHVRSNSTLKDFKIKIENTDGGLKMQCSKGSTWLDLAFSLALDKTQAIDEYGMASTEQPDQGKDPKLADYLFTITKTKDGVNLRGIKGTAWRKLSFTLGENKAQVIDQNGMSK